MVMIAAIYRNTGEQNEHQDKSETEGEFGSGHTYLHTYLSGVESITCSQTDTLPCKSPSLLTHSHTHGSPSHRVSLSFALYHTHRHTHTDTLYLLGLLQETKNTQNLSKT